jgi:hypothetical protein
LNLKRLIGMDDHPDLEGRLFAGGRRTEKANAAIKTRLGEDPYSLTKLELSGLAGMKLKSDDEKFLANIKQQNEQGTFEFFSALKNNIHREKLLFRRKKLQVDKQRQAALAEALERRKVK